MLEAISYRDFSSGFGCDTPVGVSPSVLRKQLKQMEVLLPQFQAECENRVKGQSRLEEALDQAKQAGADYHEHLQGVAEEIHLFSLSDNRPKSAKQVEAGLGNRAKAFERIANDQGIEDKSDALKTFFFIEQLGKTRFGNALGHLI